MTTTLATALSVDVGQASDKGRKAENQDHCAVNLAKGQERHSKGISLAMADGISTSQVSQMASVSAVNTFLNDYYCTSDALTVETAGKQVIRAINAWLFAQSRQSEYRFEREKGYVCTFAALIIKGRTAHLFSVGDTRIYRVKPQGLEALTADHRVWVSQHESVLSRALGVNEVVDVDYQRLQVQANDMFLLATDGVYEHIDGKTTAEQLLQSQDLPAMAKALIRQAWQSGSDDNLSAQIVRVNAIEEQLHSPVEKELANLTLPPVLQVRDTIDDYVIERQIYASSRSHVYLAKHRLSEQFAALKIPSIDLRHDNDYLERFLLEEWIARRINSPYVLKAFHGSANKTSVYTVCEYLQGQSLSQWLVDNPKPSIAQVRDIITQVAAGLRAFHRLEMVHQDLRPENIMIDQQGSVKIIDFGSTRVAGLIEYSPAMQQEAILGTALYTAPEYFVGEIGTSASDQFSLGVLAYYLLSGRFPYGNAVSQQRTLSQQRKLKYQPLSGEESIIPVWIDMAVERAVKISPHKRYEAISEFIFDLHQPNKTYLKQTKAPLVERHPVRFWQGTSALLALVILFLLAFKP